MSNSNVVRTGIAGRFQTGQYFGKQLASLPNSTLNQKLNIHQDVELASSDKQACAYLAVGNGGHGFTIGANNRVKWQTLHHTTKHGALYNQRPFVLRTLDNDLTPTERMNYRLRRLETHHGVQYVAYYLRALDLSNTDVVMEERHVEDGVTTSRPYVPGIETLNPVPPALVTGAEVTTTGDYLASSAKVKFTMTPEEVQEYINACNIIEGEEGYAVISEMATVIAADRTVVGEFNNGPASYVEAIGCTVSSFIASAFVMEHQTDGISMTIDVGAVEPVLEVSA